MPVSRVNVVPVVRHAALTGLLLGLTALLALFAAGLAALIVLPAPTHTLALLAVVVGEKSFVPGLVGLAAGLAAALQAGRLRSGSLRLLAGVIALLGLLAVAGALVPPVQALLLARARGVSLDLGRYLTAPVQHAPGKAPFTLPFATVAGQTLRMDVYPAAQADARDAPDGPRRAVVVVHGGGWSSGERAETARSNAWLAAQGYHVFDVDYRLAPAAHWKEITGDVKCAVGWLKRTARLKLGERTIEIDPDRVALLGRSAGGHLALLAAYTAGDADLPPSCTVKDTGVDAVISFYAPTDLVWGYANPTRARVYDSQARLRGLLGGAPDQVGDAYAKASPLMRVHAQAPPTLLLHGRRDQFASPLHSDWLAARLRALGVVHDQLMIPYGQHGFDYVVGGLSGQLAEAAITHFLADVDRRKAKPAAPSR